MNLNLDLIVGALTGLLAVCAFSLHILSSPTRGNWLTLPKHIRWGLGVTGFLMLIRSVNLFSVSAEAAAAPGHVNYETVAVSLALAYTAISFTIYAAAQRLPDRAWDRLAWVSRWMRHHNDAVPMILTADEVLKVHHALGQPAVAGDDPAGVVHEARRAQRMVSRR